MMKVNSHINVSMEKKKVKKRNHFQFIVKRMKVINHLKAKLTTKMERFHTNKTSMARNRVRNLKIVKRK